MKQALQERHYDYVIGPNQDSRLASVAPGAVVEEVLLQVDSEAPFVLRSRAVRCKYASGLTQGPLNGLKTHWAGPQRDYRMNDYILESLQMVYYGQGGNPKPIAPEVVYPPKSVIRLDLKNTGASTITNLTFYFRGVQLFPWGVVPGYTYPRKFASQTFSYPVPVVALGVSEYRPDQIFTVKPDADFVLRAGQGPTLFSVGTEAPRVFAEVAIVLKDWNMRPYSNDFVHFDILFGTGSAPATIPVGPTPVFVSPFGTGPGQPGLLYPEIYVPRNHQLRFDLQRSDGVAGTNQAEDFTFNFIGGKVFER
jgi:hypothetical protein